MGAGSVAATAVAVVAVVGGAVLLTLEPPEAPPGPTPAASPVGTSRVEYGWPTGESGDVVRPYAGPPERWAAGHRGVDLGLAAGAPVRAAADGVVVFAGAVAGRGVVSVDHADGVRTTYEPVAAAVRRGHAVTRGQVVGSLEARGHHCAPNPCLHWGARRGRDSYLDPLGLLADDVVIRLLPEHRT